MKRFKAFLDLTRPPNGLLMFIAVLAGVALSDTKSLDPMRLLLAFIVSYTLNGSSMGFNDYFDRDVDKVNAPHRPIPSGLIAPGEALVFSSALCAAGRADRAATSTPEPSSIGSTVAARPTMPRRSGPEATSSRRPPPAAMSGAVIRRTINDREDIA